MLLADTNVFIDFWNNPTEEATKTFEKEDIAICGVIRAELLHGAVSEKDFNEITTMLGAFDELSIEHEDWQLLGEYLYKLRKNGVSVPLSDAVIAMVAIKYDVAVWTGDKHFTLIQAVLPSLKIYS